MNSAGVAATVAALRGIDGIDRVVVVDDGSTDDTIERALAAGAEVLELPVNRGKGAALTEAVLAHPDAPWYLLADADLADTAAHLSGLVDRLLAGDGDLVVARFPPAGGQAGSGRIKALSAAAIRRTTGTDVVEPLSGQRRRRQLLRSLRLAPRFGVEVGMSIGALRHGARLVRGAASADPRAQRPHLGRAPTPDPAGHRHRPHRVATAGHATNPSGRRARRGGDRDPRLDQPGLAHPVARRGTAGAHCGPG
ncbi:MAG: glycosyltransferase [Microthrixaceae bacterium]